MKPINEFKKEGMSEMDMSQIQGGIKWNVWEVINTDPITGVTTEQRHNWWGLNGTTDTRADNCK